MNRITLIACLTICTVAPLMAQESQNVPLAVPQTGDPMQERTLNMEINVAIDRSLDWLAARQKENGMWSNEQFPALTALPAWTFIRSEHPDRERIVEAAVEAILDAVQPDGGIYRTIEGRKGGGLSNYNTAIAMTVLHATGDPELTPVVLKARTFIAEGQHMGEDQFRGGFGYDASTDRNYTDIMNTMYALEAMRYTAEAEELRPAGEAKATVNWDAAAAFVSSLQNQPGETPASQGGGFFYKPGESKAGTMETEDGRILFRSYGSMTYTGLLSLIYAGVDRSDPRVRSAFDWASRHWTLDENPGMGKEGYFFFFNVLSRALNAFGADYIPQEGQEEALNWRRATASRLVRMQKIDADTGQGYWVNEDGRFWENDPILVTAYALLALQTAAGE